MNRSDNTPLLVGFGVATQRELDPLRAREAIDLMLDAVRVAAQDPGCAALLPSVQRIAVPRGRWSYSNPGGMIAGVIGARHATTVLSEVGVLQQTLIGETCNQIASGQIEAALVVGGDTGYRILRARQTGLPAFERESGSEPDVTMKPHNALRHDAELRAGLQMPVGLYAICESAFRARHGWDVDTHRDHLARLCPKGGKGNKRHR